METIEGVVEGIIYYAPDSGYTVLSLTTKKPHPKADGDEITVVGKVAVELHPGEPIRAVGSWTTHREYGQQFKADHIVVTVNTSTDVKKYLSGGAIKGISPEAASKISKHFGAQALDILDADPERIKEVRGLKSETAAKIARAWGEARKSRKVMTYLQNIGITAGFAQKIYEMYGDDAIQQVEADPYQLALDIDGIGFQLVDKVAIGAGRSFDAPERVIAGLIYALQQLASDGHVYAPRGLVVDKAADLLGVERDLCDSAVTTALKRKLLIKKMRPLNTSGAAEALYLPEVYEKESRCAEILVEMARSPQTRLKKAKSFKWTAFFERMAGKASVTLTEQQQNAVHAALTHKISVLTGGPGTGKTTTLRTVIQALDAIKASYALASPTGRAAKRLSEATQRPASTLHRLLGYSVDGTFTADSGNPVDADMIIVDETSMVDLDLFFHLLDATAPGTHLLLVGDVDQLPSVGAGNVLHDVISGGIAFTTRLDVIFRQASDSLIVVNAHKVNHGEMPDLTNNNSDFYLFGVESDDSFGAVQLVVDIVTNRIPRKFGLDPLRDVQVLAPMYKGEVGINALNEGLQAVLNPEHEAEEVTLGSRRFRIGDKVIQTRNNYELDVYNGDIGQIVSYDAINQTLTLDVDGRLLEYEPKDTTDLMLAYAISVHRSQGGEYPAVVMPVVTKHSFMLRRNLLYTAITRARQLVVLVGSRRAVQIAVENGHVLPRYSGLGWLLNHKLEVQD